MIKNASCIVGKLGASDSLLYRWREKQRLFPSNGIIEQTPE
jgi:hypothetical protein